MSTPSKPSANTAATSGSEPPHSSAIQVAENIDLLTKILICLPAKSLMRFKSVSKQWLSLISHPSFSLRLMRSPSGFLLKCCDSYEYDFVDLNPNPNPNPPRAPFRSLAFDGDRSGIRIVQSCNGLLLCCNRSQSSYYVYNPTTKQHAALPRTDETAICGTTLAFDPSRSPGYKAVCVRNSSGDRDGFWIEIFSSEAGLWRPSDLGSFTARLDTVFDFGVFWNSSVHWVSHRGPWLRFDVDEERLSEMPKPPVSVDLLGLYRTFGYFAESCGRLHCVDYRFKHKERPLTVYELERDYSRWFVKYAVDLSPISAVFPDMTWDPVPVSESESEYESESESESDDDQVALPTALPAYLMSVLCVVGGDSEKDSFLVMNVPGCLLRYDFEDGTFRKLCDVAVECGVFESLEAHLFIESLACV